MAAADSTRLTLVDEEDIPIPFLRVTHGDSENDQPSHIDSSEEKESADDSGEETVTVMRIRSKNTLICSDRL